jgi:hypothetical protein
MRHRLTQLLAQLRAAGRWVVRHWPSVWPPLAIALLIALSTAFIYVVPMQLVHRDNASTPDSLILQPHLTAGAGPAGLQSRCSELRKGGVDM